jgi:bacillithiol biosynthesis cysteine-adding enzyme BshC
LIPDEARLKAQMIPVFRQDLFENTSSGIVADTSKRLGELYNVQAYPRDINLFYFKDDIRERIERRDDQFYVLNTSISFSKLEIEAELNNYPERFSPNVILRGLFQETILPNIAFIGGGGELAYWLQLKDLFAHYHIVYPVLVLRNSFLVMDTRWKDLAQNLGLSTEQVFQSPFNLLNGIIAQEGSEPHLNGEVESIKNLYDSLKQTVAVVDPTLRQHIEALKVKATNALVELERKMQRAERKKRGHTRAQIDKLKTGLFPNQNLQERSENVASFYSKWGRGFIDELYKHSLTLEQEFVVLKKD